MTTMAVALARLAAVAELAERLLRENNPIGSELVGVLGAPVASQPGGVQSAAMFELALWAKRYAGELGPETLAALVAGELVHLWRDQGKTLEEFSAALALSWLSVAEAVETIDALELDSSGATCDRSH
jgi:hypothetical protein